MDFVIISLDFPERDKPRKAMVKRLSVAPAYLLQEPDLDRATAAVNERDRSGVHAAFGIGQLYGSRKELV
jgi:hypothetical protein